MVSIVFSIYKWVEQARVLFLPNKLAKWVTNNSYQCALRRKNHQCLSRRVALQLDLVKVSSSKIALMYVCVRHHLLHVSPPCFSVVSCARTIALFNHEPKLIVTRVNDSKKIGPGFSVVYMGLPVSVKQFPFLSIEQNKLLNDSKVLVYFCQTKLIKSNFYADVSFIKIQKIALNLFLLYYSFYYYCYYF